jgi:fucose 4-O-acetylase-like acetyltransferase
MQRNRLFDLMKGVGIVLVFIPHIVIPHNSFLEWFSHYVNSFHMAMFFIIAGIFSESYVESSFKEMARKTFNGIILPFVLFCGISSCVWGTLVACGVREWIGWLNVWKSLLAGLPCMNGPLWFLVSLGIGKVLLWGAVRVGRRTNGLWWLFVAVCVFLQARIVSLDEATLYGAWFRCSNLPFCFILLSAGYWLRKLVRGFQWQRLSVFSCVGIVLLAGYFLQTCYHYCPNVAFYLGLVGTPGSYLSSCVGFVLVLVGCVLLEKLPLVSRLTSWIDYIGENSLYFFGLEAGVVSPLFAVAIERSGLGGGGGGG